MDSYNSHFTYRPPCPYNQNNFSSDFYDDEYYDQGYPSEINCYNNSPMWNNCSNNFDGRYFDDNFDQSLNFQDNYCDFQGSYSQDYSNVSPLLYDDNNYCDQGNYYDNFDYQNGYQEESSSLYYSIMALKTEIEEMNSKQTSAINELHSVLKEIKTNQGLGDFSPEGLVIESPEEKPVLDEENELNMTKENHSPQVIEPNYVQDDPLASFIDYYENLIDELVAKGVLVRSVSIDNHGKEAEEIHNNNNNNGMEGEMSKENSNVSPLSLDELIDEQEPVCLSFKENREHESEHILETVKPNLEVDCLFKSEGIDHVGESLEPLEYTPKIEGPLEFLIMKPITPNTIPLLNYLICCGVIKSFYDIIIVWLREYMGLRHLTAIILKKLETLEKSAPLDFLTKSSSS